MTNTQLPSQDTIIQQTRQWIRSVVIGLNLCPFAARPVDRGTVRYVVSDAQTLEACLTALMQEVQRLDEDESIDTTLLILPAAFSDFEDFLELTDLADALLEENDYEGVYQVASFHPDYHFADAPEDDPADFTNRSIYPMLHLLREEQVEQAIDSHPDPDGIPVSEAGTPPGHQRMTGNDFSRTSLLKAGSPVDSMAFKDASSASAWAANSA